MANFTPVEALIGGGLIGVAAVAMMLFLGRIAGISGIAGGLLSAPASDAGWRVAFLLGLIAAPFLVGLVGGTMPAVETPHSTALMIAGGLLVGLGSRMGSGCTSGHGVCGMARMSRRSLAATVTFMATGIVTVFVVRHLFGA
ncbi:MAG: YeeE/YedE family protein [Alphaproteobacteria bacterium]